MLPLLAPPGLGSVAIDPNATAFEQPAAPSVVELRVRDNRIPNADGAIGLMLSMSTPFGSWVME